MGDLMQFQLWNRQVHPKTITLPVEVDVEGDRRLSSTAFTSSVHFLFEDVDTPKITTLSQHVQQVVHQLFEYMLYKQCMPEQTSGQNPTKVLTVHNCTYASKFSVQQFSFFTWLWRHLSSFCRPPANWKFLWNYIKRNMAHVYGTP